MDNYEPGKKDSGGIRAAQIQRPHKVYMEQHLEWKSYNNAPPPRGVVVAVAVMMARVPHGLGSWGRLGWRRGEVQREYTSII